MMQTTKEVICSYGLKRYALVARTHKFIWIYQDGSNQAPKIEAYEVKKGNETFVGYLAGDTLVRMLGCFAVAFPYR
jgi:hypothetical protein